MKRHWMYLKYLLRHKWFVWVAGRKLGCSAWRLLVHDMSKFRPSEWGPYARAFYNADGSPAEWKVTPETNRAWLLHQHRNPHHWQYWLLREDRPDRVYSFVEDGQYEGNTRLREHSSGLELPVPALDVRSAIHPMITIMAYRVLHHANADAGILKVDAPRDVVKEMVADWAGAGRAITGKWDVQDWYGEAMANRRISMSPRMEAQVETLIYRLSKTRYA